MIDVGVAVRCLFSRHPVRTRREHFPTTRVYARVTSFRRFPWVCGTFVAAVTPPYPRFPARFQDGKEGVSGSSPEEGFRKSAAYRRFLVQIDLLRVERAVGMEPRMEPSGQERAPGHRFTAQVADRGHRASERRRAALRTIWSARDGRRTLRVCPNARSARRRTRPRPASVSRAARRCRHARQLHVKSGRQSVSSSLTSPVPRASAKSGIRSRCDASWRAISSRRG
jgi:hypothetical protein